MRHTIALRRLCRQKDKAVRQDKRRRFEGMLGCAAKAASHNDTRTLYKLVKASGGKPPAPHQGINDESHTLLTDIADIEQRWTRHYCDLLAAVPNSSADTEAPEGRITGDAVKPSFEQIHGRIGKLNEHKATGLCDVSASLMKAGGGHASRQLADIASMMGERGHFPKVWRGAWLANIYKNKGEEAECGNYRGIQVCGQPVKVVCGWLQSIISPALRGFMGNWQFGLPRMGTALANHTLRTWQHVCHQKGWSTMILFVDLEKAFDRICRQLVCGWLDGEGEGEQALKDCGIDTQAAAQMVQVIRKGTVCERVGLKSAAADLLRSLHSGAWAQVGRQGSTKFTTKKGGRQGCTFGPDMFCSAYELPMADTRKDVESAGSAVIAHREVGAFWSGMQLTPPRLTEPGVAHEPKEDEEHGSMVIYVDDLGVLVAAPTPKQLMARAPACIDSLANHLAKFDMVMNMGPNKTEAFVRLVGKDQAKYKAEIAASGHVLKTPEGRVVRVVEQYAHLGSHVSASMDDNVDVDRRCGVASQTIAALARPVFGNPVFSVSLRLKLGKSLVLSRLLYCVHVWSNFSPWALRKLATVYHRLLRHIAGQSWRGELKDGKRYMSDLEIRVMLGMPPLEHLIAQRRLIYLIQLLRSDASYLRALLATQEATKHGWTKLLICDLSSFWSFHASRLQELGNPQHNSGAWACFIRSWPRQWKELVKMWPPSDSTGQGSSFEQARTAKAGRSKAKAVLSSCSVCSANFESERALAMHMRFKHQSRSQVGRWCGGDCVCVVCGQGFSTRLRLIAHLTDSRVRFGRQPCHKFIHRFPMLAAAEQERLDLIDRAARRAAQRKGCTQPKSVSAPKRALTDAEMPHLKRRRMPQKAPAIWECAQKRRRLD